MAIGKGQILKSHTSSCKNSKGSIGNRLANYKAVFCGEKLAPDRMLQECNIAATTTPQFTAYCSEIKPVYRPGCAPLLPLLWRFTHHKSMRRLHRSRPLSAPAHASSRSRRRESCPPTPLNGADSSIRACLPAPARSCPLRPHRPCRQQPHRAGRPASWPACWPSPPSPRPAHRPIPAPA